MCFYLELRKRFDIVDNKPMRKTIPVYIYVWAKETPLGMKGRFVRWWRRIYPMTTLLKSTSPRIRQEVRPDIIPLAQLRLDQQEG